MSVTIMDVARIAKLARLTFTEEEKEKLTKELNEILNYVEHLNALDTTNVEPLSHLIEPAGDVRDDAVKESLAREDVLRNAPDRTEQYFRVPKVIR